VLLDARRRGVTLSALQAQLPERYTFSERLQDYPTARSQALIAHLEQGTQTDIMARLSGMFGELAGTADGIDRTDGLRIHFAGGDIIHLRPSGNAPELRCYTESDSAERAAMLNAQALGLVRDCDIPA
jgi:phosphomannomutase